MKLLTYILLLITTLSFSQEKDKAQLLALQKSNDYVYEGNDLVAKEDYIAAEMAYRKAISEKPETIAGMYNLGNSYYDKGAYNEALYRLEQAAKTATNKEEKHKAFHNIGNILMKNKQCKEAVEAYKNALRNNPTDDETRYNLGIAKVCAEEQKEQEDQNKDDKENKDENKDQENKDDKKEEGDKDNKDGDNKDDKKDQENKEDKKDEGDKDKKEDGKPKDDKKDQGKGDKEKEENQQPQPQQGQLSPQQIKSLLEAMSNQEQKVQEKMNEEKQQGVIIKTDKDW
jgi:Ca-activated chloride channel homolog